MNDSASAPTVRESSLAAGFEWGEPYDIGTAAFWVAQCPPTSIVALDLGRDLREEVAACILGGYGVPGHVGVAAFEHLRNGGLLEFGTSEQAIREALSEPLRVAERGCPMRYRFANQRARRIADALTVLAIDSPPDEPVALRDWLVDRIAGVGPKTASWIVRNRYDDAPVAVVDIHIHRVGIGAGFFDSEWQLPRDYHRFETAFLEVADIGGVSPGLLDHTIWSTMASVSLPTRAMLCRFALDLGEHRAPTPEQRTR